MNLTPWTPYKSLPPDRIHGRISRIEYKRTKGRACRRRDKSISDKLHQVHTPWYKRPVKESL
tara:strand:+ start:722 stop:907 length:186 start_codon:yes stop_codon:yes gene_type:complete